MKSTAEPVVSQKCSVLKAVLRRLGYETLSEVQFAAHIARKRLYFRASLTQQCNVSCAYCHAEGGATQRTTTMADYEAAYEEARGVGFERIQLTGGEPLVVDNLSEHISLAKIFFKDVGITTNGTLLSRRLGLLSENVVNRIHVSVHDRLFSHLADADTARAPAALTLPIMELQALGTTVRFNVPVPTSNLDQCRVVLERLRPLGASVELFSLLPFSRGAESPPEFLFAMQRLADEENHFRSSVGLSGLTTVRGYLSPEGARCGNCSDLHRCRDKGRSLRVGADGILRPCLATRTWDVQPDPHNYRRDFRLAVAYALDF